MGRKKQAVFRIVVASGVHPRDGRNTETIGKYNPRTHPSFIEIDEKRALYWLRQGAQASESVRALFRKTGIMRKFAEGAEGEGLATVGDGGSKTVFTAAAARGQVAAKVPKKPKAAKPKAAAKAEAASAAEPEAEAVVATASEVEAATEAEAPAPSEAEISGEPGAAAEPEAEAQAEPEAEVKAEAASTGEPAASAEAGEGDEEAREDSNDEDGKS